MSVREDGQGTPTGPEEQPQESPPAPDVRPEGSAASADVPADDVPGRDAEVVGVGDLDGDAPDVDEAPGTVGTDGVAEPVDPVSAGSAPTGTDSDGTGSPVPEEPVWPAVAHEPAGRPEPVWSAVGPVTGDGDDEQDEPGGAARSGEGGGGDAAPGATEPRPTGWAALGRALSLRPTRSQGLAALLCGLLGFALVVQVQQSAQDPLSSARQDDLVRLLDEVTQRSERLADEVDDLTRTRDELASGTGQAQAALDLAEERAASEGILSGRLPAVGPGIEIVVRDGAGALEAAKLFNVLEELRNAGAEVVELNGVRLVTSTWFLDGDDGIVVDGVTLEPPYRWTVIGDPATLNPALEIPGGALATLRTAGAEARTVEHDEVEVTAVREPAEPQYATPSDPGR